MLFMRHNVPPLDCVVSLVVPYFNFIATSIHQELFGPYECSFNILPGSSVKQKVFFRSK